MTARSGVRWCRSWRMPIYVLVVVVAVIRRKTFCYEWIYS